MSWKQSIPSLLIDILRVAIRGCLLINGILLALFSIWFTVRFLYSGMHWLSRVLFDTPW